MADIKDTKRVADIIGENKVDEIINKDWKVADLPTEEDLAKEEHKSPKARSNVNSRKNLVQYQEKKPIDIKAQAIKNLKTRIKRKNINPFELIKLQSKEKVALLKTFLPMRSVFSGADEELFCYTIVNSLLSDFDEEDLTAGDLEDIVGLAINRVMVDRLMTAASKTEMGILDVGPTIEKFRKQSKDLKANLANRRADRTDPRAKQNYSIVDLVHAYDDKRKKEFDQRISEWEKKKSKFKNKK